MKRTFLFAAVGVAFMTAAVSTFVYVNNGSNSMDELFDANVEALTQWENSGSGKYWVNDDDPHAVICTKGGNMDC